MRLLHEQVPKEPQSKVPVFVLMRSFLTRTILHTLIHRPMLLRSVRGGRLGMAQIKEVIQARLKANYNIRVLAVTNSIVTSSIGRSIY